MLCCGSIIISLKVCNADPTADKPFASYWANYLFAQKYAKAGENMKKLLNFGAPKPTEKPEEKTA